MSNCFLVYKTMKYDNTEQVVATFDNEDDARALIAIMEGSSRDSHISYIFEEHPLNETPAEAFKRWSEL